MLEFKAQLFARFEDWFVIESEYDFSGISISNALEGLARYIFLEALADAGESIKSYISSELDRDSIAEYQMGELSAGLSVQVSELDFGLFLPYKDGQFDLASAEITEDQFSHGVLFLNLLKIKSL